MMTIGEMIEQLEMIADEYGSDVEVRLATQPNWPFEYSITDTIVATADIDFDEDEEDEDEEPMPNIVYIGEGRQIGYLPGGVRDAVWG